ncbi:MAG TPA: UDP-N-acetylmuramate--L-alanine ligase, partial [Myxococcales bacterium]|nr:UDP-N-acetylmuramate--L-alanine ligase [Myxococcales bacterium]
MLSLTKRVHLIGIGGIGVSAVARILMSRGFQVSGSDVRESQLTTALRNEGATVTIGHDAALIEGSDMVVYSTAIPDTNPELVAARNSEITVKHRAEILGALLKGYRSLGVIGTHGKGTVCAMSTKVLDTAGRNPSFIIGGLLNDFGCNARATDSDTLVVEIDESDGSLVHVRP